jgi:hypothetical protein
MYSFRLKETSIAFTDQNDIYKEAQHAGKTGEELVCSGIKKCLILKTIIVALFMFFTLPQKVQIA